MLALGSPDGIIDAIERENILYLKKFPKIGDKVARQIILDLKGKLAKSGEVSTQSNDELVDALRSLGYKNADINKVVKQVDSSLDIEMQIKEALKLGFYISFAGPVTFKNSKLKDVVKEISLEFIVLETDSPYLAPVPYRGKVNSSKYLEYIAKFISDIKNISVSELAEITSKNASSLFDFNK